MAAVERMQEAAVVAADDVLGVLRIDPEIVPVAVGPAGGVREAVASVLADDEVQVGLEEPVGIHRIDDQAREVERPPDHRLATVERAPDLAAVVGSVERSMLGLDEGVDAFRSGGRDHHLDAAPWFRRQAVPLDALPGLAAIGGAKQAAAARRLGALSTGAAPPTPEAEVSG